MSEWIVFLGPSLPDAAERAPAGATFVEPIRRGALADYLARGQRRFAIVDGEFGQSLSVSVREIRHALAQGATVWGASSMGALRASEAWPLGMRGVGWIYEAYRTGRVVSDDEVALLFDPRSRRALSVPLVNVRWALELGVERGLLSEGDAHTILDVARSIHFSERTYAELAERLDVRERAAFQPLLEAIAANPEAYDRKRLDALALLERLSAEHAASSTKPCPTGPAPSPPSPVKFTRVRPPSSAALLGDAATTLKVAGTHRQRASEALLESARREAERLGVSRLAEIGRLDVLDVYVYNTVRPDAHDYDNTVTGGKGLSAASAQVAALLEAVERACMSPLPRRPWRGTLAQLRETRRAIDPTELVLASDSTWTPDQPLHWWPMRDLCSGDEIWVPASQVFFPFTADPYLWRQGTGGLAAGSSLPEAVVYGLLEAIERDALGLSRELGWAWPVALESVRHPELVALIEKLKAHDVHVHAWLLCADVELPTFEVVLEDARRKDPMYLNGGHACHLDPVEALRGALLEAVFARVSVIAGAREDLADQKRAFEGHEFEHVRQQVLGWRNPDGRALDFSSLPDFSTSSLSGDLAVTLRALKRAGYAPLACDLSCDDSAFAVVRCVVPGMLGKQTANRVHPRIAALLREDTTPRA